MYSLFTHKDGYAYMVLRISDEAAFNEAMKVHNLKIVSAQELGLK